MATEVQEVAMQDGRTVGFAGKRKVIKDVLIDPSKIVVEGGVTQIEDGAVSVRFDLRDGSTRTFAAPAAVVAELIGHGLSQKMGDELASPADKPMSEEDMVLALEAMYDRLAKGDWRAVREGGGGGVSGAGIVVRAIMEVKGKDQATVKAFLDGILERTPGLTRRALYDSFRAEGTPTAAVIARLEAEKAKKAPAVDAAEALSGL